MAEGLFAIGSFFVTLPLRFGGAWRPDRLPRAAYPVLFRSLMGLLARATAGTLAIGSRWLPRVAVLVGGLLGSYLGALASTSWSCLLAAVLTIACGELLLLPIA